MRFRVVFGLLSIAACSSSSPAKPTTSATPLVVPPVVDASAPAPAVTASIPKPVPPTCTVVGQLPVRRYDPSATTLLDGRVLITGGRADDGANYGKETWLFEPATQKLTDGPKMAEARAGHRAALLADGRILVAGGMADAIEVFDPKRKAWSTVGKMVPHVFDPAVLRLDDGRVFIGGGDLMWKGALSSTVQIFDPQKNIVKKAKDAPFGWSGDLNRTHDDRVLLVTHPYNPETDKYDTQAAWYDAATDAWKDTSRDVREWVAPPNLEPSEAAHQIVSKDGKIGSPSIWFREDHLEIEEAPGSWRALATFAGKHTDGVATRLDDGRILVVGHIEAPTTIEICPGK